MPIPFSRNLKGVDRYREFLRGVPNQIPAAICYLPLPNGFTSGKSLPLLLAKGLAQLLLSMGIDMKKFAAFLLGKLTPPEMCTQMRFVTGFCGLFLLVSLNGCGGGGGGSLVTEQVGPYAGYTGATYNSKVADYFRTGVNDTGLSLNSYQEFQNLSAYSVSSTVHPNVLTNVHKAYGYSLSGSGKTIAILDSGFNSIQEYRERKVFAEMQSKYDAGQIADGGLFTTELARTAADTLAVTSDEEENWHGTVVASIAAAPIQNTGSAYYTDMQTTYSGAGSFYSYTADRPNLVHGMMGVAYNAGLFLTDVRTHTDLLQGLTAATTAAANAGAVVQNNSWGLINTPVPGSIPSDISSYTSLQAGAYLVSVAGFTAEKWVDYYNALSSFQSGGVIVFALSNDQNSSSLVAALPQIYPNLQAAWITVGNIDTAGTTPTVTRQSSACGVTASYCLVADGTDITGANLTNNLPYRSGLDGTSFAAPQVSGMIAILAEAFPSLTPADLVTRLLATANNSFFTPTAQRQFTSSISHGYNTEFGHGIPDLYAALQPITSGSRPVGFVFMGSPNSGLLRPMASTGLQASPMMLRGLQASLKGQSALVYDALGAGFQVPLSVFLQTGGSPALLGQWLSQPFLNSAHSSHQGDGGGYFYSEKNGLAGDRWSLASQFSLAEFSRRHQESFGLSEVRATSGLYASKLGAGFVHQPMQFATGFKLTESSRLFTYLGESRTTSSPYEAKSAERPNVMGTAMSITLENSETTLGQVLFGFQQEDKALRGSSGEGALQLGRHSRSIYFAPVFSFRHASGWNWQASASLGFSKTKASAHSLITGSSPVVTSEFMLGASNVHLFDEGDQLSFQVWQPETVESGYLKMQLPSLVGPNDPVSFTSSRLDLSDQPRMFVYSMAYQKRLSAQTVLRQEVFLLPGLNEQGLQRSQLGFAVKLQHRF